MNPKEKENLNSKFIKSKIRDEAGSTLAETIISLILLSGILFPIIWLFMNLSAPTIYEQHIEAIRYISNHLMVEPRFTTVGSDTLLINQRVYTYEIKSESGYLNISLIHGKDSVFDQNFIPKQ